MTKKLLLLLLCAFITNAVFAQRMKNVIKRKIAEAAVMYNEGVYDGNYRGLGANIHYLWGIGRNKQRFSIGLGLREYNFSAKNREYVTSDQSLVAKLKNGTDSIYFEKQNSSLLNGYLALQMHIKRGIDFGLHLDIGGLTFGGSKEGFFHSYELTLTERKKVLVQPFAFNFNPFFSNYGLGSSFNEAYFSFNGGKIMRYRLGFDYFVNEVNTKTPQTGNGTRFRSTNYLVMGAIAWNIRYNKARYDMFNFND